MPILLKRPRNSSINEDTPSCSKKIFPSQPPSLSSSGFGLNDHNHSQYDWDNMYLVLAAFRRQEGHCNVPEFHVEDGTNLGSWLVRQRHLKKKGTLGIERIIPLDELGIVWDVSADWEPHYQLLLKFHEREGHCNVPYRHVEDGTKLGYWLSRQKQSKKKGSLDTECITRLDKLGNWEYCSGSIANYIRNQWERNYQLLCKLYEREGHCDVTYSHVEDGTKLGRWLASQRQTKKKGSLSTERVSRLDKLGDWEYSSRSKKNWIANQWERNYQLLCKFYEREGHSYVPFLHVEGETNLGLWIRRQRHLKKTGRLDIKRASRLNMLGNWDIP